MSSENRLEGKVALVTGAASGIGCAVAQLFAGEGALISMMDLEGDQGSLVEKRIRSAGGTALFLNGDVADSLDCQRVVATTIREFKALHVLVNCAGIIQRASILEMNEEEWDRSMAVNVKSVFLLAREAIPLMETGQGTVINVASGWGLVGGRKAAAYCASKGAVVQLTRAMALDHGTEGVRVNCICPGDTDTPMLKSEASQLGIPVGEFIAEAQRRPLGRVGTPMDVARAALFLASDDAAFITGATLVVDGGGLA